MASANPAPDKATSFVNGLAWSFIGLSAFSTLLAALQYVLFARVVPTETLRALFADAIQLKLLPPAMLNLLAYIPAFCAAPCAASLLTLWVSVALLKRRNWARIGFAWIMIATAILHFAGIVLPFYLMPEFSALLNDMPPDIRGVVGNLAQMLSAMSIVMGIAFGVAFAWIAKRLFSAEIAREFAARDDADTP